VTYWIYAILGLIGAIVFLFMLDDQRDDNDPWQEEYDKM